jgi:hypothetical protein
MSGPNVFLSYANVDRPRVEGLVRMLESQGLDVWWDRDIPRGKNFNRVIEEALQQAKCAIVIWSQASVTSEWVFNEASAARKRGILVPVLIDAVEPPLEFRHLQTARLVDWHGDARDPEWIGLLDAVRGLVGQGEDASRNLRGAAPMAVQRRYWWQTPAGIAVGAGGLLLGVAVLLLALKEVGLLGGAESTPRPAVSPPGLPPPAAQAPAAVQPVAATPAAPPPRPSVEEKAATGWRINLLAPDDGGRLVIASEDNWRKVIEPKLDNAIIGTRGFAVFAFRDEKPATIDAVGVFVESSDMHNLKELAIYASVASSDVEGCPIGEQRKPISSWDSGPHPKRSAHPQYAHAVPELGHVIRLPHSYPRARRLTTSAFRVFGFFSGLAGKWP